MNGLQVLQAQGNQNCEQCDMHLTWQSRWQLLQYGRLHAAGWRNECTGFGNV